MNPAPPAILGVRHHGPGSARSVVQALETLQPDAVLIEGPPDAQSLLPLAVHPQMIPPVALVLYVPEEPRRAAYYPFASFSPEWQAIRYGLEHRAAVRFMDLPQTHRLALVDADPRDDERVFEDPLRWVAQAAGFEDSERWWEHMVESRRDSTAVFQGIVELMAALRDQAIGDLPPLEAQREAYMRNSLRAAQREGFERIAVVCGAWHAPALADLPSQRDDNLVLKDFPRIKMNATWVPWTYGRLSWRSGYGAGVESPGYYHHLWTHPEDITVQWMARVARLLREQDLGASTASVIEAVRLAEALAALRERPVPALGDLLDAVRAVFCFGDEAPMRLIGERLIVGERLGAVPPETPGVPLQKDLRRLQRRLRLPAEAAQRSLDLDLRKPNDRQRSQLLRRLDLLDVPWGAPERAGGRGTFREAWRLQWRPELAVAVIAANVWGNTVVDAATALACDAARRAEALPALTGLVERVLLADLPEAVGELMRRLENLAALSSDVPHLMDALPPLANVLRYGNVRRTDAGTIAHVVDGLVTRICIGLPGACATLDDEAAQAMFERFQATNGAVVLLQDERLLADWSGVLQKMLDQRGLHGLLAGRCCRLLFDRDGLAVGETARRLRLALSGAEEPAQAAAWIEGFLRGSGLILLHNEALWRILDDWVAALREDVFVQMLPLLRRTFAGFPAPERRQMGERAKRAAPGSGEGAAAGDAFDAARADRVLPLAAQLLGIDRDRPATDAPREGEQGSLF